MSNITNSHDRFFKSVFSVKEEAADFLANYLPEGVAGILQLDSLELGAGSYVDEDLKESLSDLVYRVDTKSAGPALVYILFEHKSYPEPLIAFYLLRYMVKIWGQLIEQGSKGRLPPIIPLVLYHGATKWQVDRGFSRLVDHHPALQSFLPDFRFLYYDLGEYEEEDIRGEAGLRMTLVLLKLIFHPVELKERIRDILEMLRQMERTGRPDYGKKVMSYLISNQDKISHQDLMRAVEEVFKDIKEGDMPGFVQTWYQEGIQKGLLQGRQEGLQQGMQQGLQQGLLTEAREAVLDILESRFSAVPSPMAALINQLGDTAVLKKLRKKAATVETLEDFRQVMEQTCGN
ncbi:MAG: Rpn family recombination-promoting nuclease/putative transposase [Deltaproteobacteria bacterium]|nr:Rpn family recombination-promoting nuclease/putative transposase [Deltaproteobacteria bacterium]